MARQTPGNYVPLDVNYARDTAIRKAGTNAELLYIRSLAYAKGARTSGFVSDFDLEVVAVGMRSVRAAVEKLIEVGLWVRVGDGWVIRSWERWNASDRIVSAGGRLGNHKRWHVDRGEVDPECDLCADRTPIAPRSHPDSPPISPPESQGKGREGKGSTTPNGVGPRNRGHRLPDDFQPTDDLRSWARERGFNDPQIDEMTDRFRDHWHSTTGARAAKSNWNLAWRNWVGKEDPKRVRGAVHTLRPATGYTGAVKWDESKAPWNL
ncbi:MAG: hypothetical protein JWO67_4567 [Streptosporangiaceae bacterium]|nr:hypothetical protein [Streptosporangiaceae bacterium]